MSHLIHRRKYLRLNLRKDKCVTDINWNVNLLRNAAKTSVISIYLFIFQFQVNYCHDYTIKTIVFMLLKCIKNLLSVRGI